MTNCYIRREGLCSIHRYFPSSTAQDTFIDALCGQLTTSANPALCFQDVFPIEHFWPRSLGVGILEWVYWTAPLE